VFITAEKMASKKQRLAALASKRLSNSKIQNRIIDVITIAFGAQNIVGDSLAAGGTIGVRFKNIVNEALGRTTGLNPFPDAPLQFQQTFNIEGIINPQTTAGVAALIYSALTKFIPQLPLKAESRRFAKKNIAVGIGTGVFRSPSGNVSTLLATTSTTTSTVPISAT